MVTDVFEFENYRDFLTSHLSKLSSGGYGQLIKIADALDVNPSIVTQVMKGKKDFTLEQASDLCDYLGLTELEAEYFICLVQVERSGKRNLRDRMKRRLKELKAKSESLKERMPARADLDDASRALFYSHWYHSGIRILSSIDGFDSVERIAERLKLPRAVVKQSVEFLISRQLCIEDRGKIRIGPQSTHIEAGSPLVARHHANWRLKSIERSTTLDKSELGFTSPVSLSANDFERVKKVLTDAIQESFKIIDPSPAEQVAFLNVDWMKY